MSTRSQIEDALIEEYTTGLRYNPQWDRKKARDNDWEDDPDNPEYLPSERQARVEQSPWIVFTAADGHPSIATPSIREIVDVLVRAGLVLP